MQDTHLKCSHGRHSNRVVRVFHEAIVLHTLCDTCCHHHFGPPESYWCKRSLQHMDGRQDGLPGLHRSVLRRVVWISRDRPYGCGEITGLPQLAQFSKSLWIHLLKHVRYLQLVISFASIILNSIRSRIEMLGRIPGTDTFCSTRLHPMVSRTPSVLITRIDCSFLCFTNANFIRERYKHQPKVSPHPQFSIFAH